jgi:diaminopimelate epimerase
MSEIIFTKITAAGNDFILIDKKINDRLKLSSEIIKSVCNRRYGIGADGVLTITDSEVSNFEMEYFNSDGSSGMLCGNGARSIILYAEYSGRLKNKKAYFLFNGKSYFGEILEEGKIKFNLNSPSDLKLNFNLELSDTSFVASFINTGAHHVVIDVEGMNLKSFPVNKYGPEVRNHSKFNPPGTNVNFIAVNNGTINIRTYERGVEAETLACGTGSVASAIISFFNGKVKPPVILKTKSNEKLIVDFKYKNNLFSDVSLMGPAKIVFEGKIFI